MEYGFAPGGVLSESQKETHTHTFKKANYFINIPGKMTASNKISRPPDVGRRNTVVFVTVPDSFIPQQDTPQ